MSIAINNNNGIIEVSQDGSVRKSYFGAFGKLYPSGTTSIVINDVVGYDTNLPGFRVISNTLQDLVDNTYDNIPSVSNSVNPSIQFSYYILDGFINQSVVRQVNILGYSIGDLITVQGSYLGGSGSITYEVTQLAIDGFLINLEKDAYNVKWYDLVINGTSPTSLSDAANQLAILFSTI